MKKYLDIHIGPRLFFESTIVSAAMNPDRLISVLSEIRSLPDDFVAALKREISFIPLPKSHFLVEGAGIAQSIFFLERGFVLGYTYHGSRRTVTEFWSAGEIIYSPLSFYARVPSAEFIQLAEDSELFCIGYDGVVRLGSAFPAARDLCHRIAGLYVERYRRRLIALQNETTSTRYGNLLKEYPGIEQRVSQETIASYLGISPPALSRLKGRMR